jgi:hypothetical protein
MPPTHPAAETAAPQIFLDSFGPGCGARVSRAGRVVGLQEANDEI